MRQYILSLATIALLSSCEKTITVKLPEHQSKLVINSYTKTSDTIMVQVGKSMDILKFNRLKDLSVPNAAVKLYVDGVETGLLSYDQFKGLYTSNVIATPGKVYTIKVSAPSFDDAQATSQVPSFVPIAKLTHLKEVRIGAEGETQDEIRIQFHDPAGTNDFYIVRLVSPTEDSNNNNNGSFYCVNTPDPSVESIYNESIDQNTCLSGEGIFLRDALFNGEDKELRLYIGTSMLNGTHISSNGDTLYTKVELYHVSEDYFRYYKSYRSAIENNGNPFSEPTNVYSNIKNGYGIFSITSLDVRDLK